MHLRCFVVDAIRIFHHRPSSIFVHCNVFLCKDSSILNHETAVYTLSSFLGFIVISFIGWQLVKKLRLRFGQHFDVTECEEKTSHGFQHEETADGQFQSWGALFKLS